MTKSKRANGEGTISYDENKKLWRAMVTTPAGNRLSKASKDENVVKDWLNDQRLKIGRNQHIEPTGLTLGTWFDEWLEVYAKPGVRPRSYDRYKSLLDHTESISTVKLVSLTPSHLQKLYNSLNELSGQTLRHLHYCIHGALQQAVINQLMYNNPANAVKAPKVVKKEIEIYTDAEIKLIKKAAIGTRLAIVITIARTTGMRLSEILGLRWEDIDIKKSTISIKQTVQKSISEGVQIAEPKTKGSKRKITIPPEIVQEILEYKLATGGRKGLMFQTKNGTPMHSTLYLRYYFDPIKKAAGINKNFHSFRHTHASSLLAEGVPIQDVSKRLGHARVSTTLDIYAHCMPNSDDRMMDKLAEIMARQK